MSRSCASTKACSAPSTGTRATFSRKNRRRWRMPEVLEKEILQEEKVSAPVLPTVAVVGLGYVGLPVAVEFGKRRPTVGYDLSKKRVENLRHHVDATGEVPTADLLEARHLRCSAHPGEIGEADFIIVAVP